MSASFNAETELTTELERALTDRAAPSRSDHQELAELIALARALELSAGDVRPSDAFRHRARRQLLAHMATSPVAAHVRISRAAVEARQRIGIWLGRFAAGAAALAMAGTATAVASASALPGDLLYPVKEVSEAVAVQAAPSEAARQQVLLRQADARLDETTRLLQQARGDDAAVATERLRQTLQTLEAGADANETVWPGLERAESRLSALLQTAPASAEPGLGRALESARRGISRGVRAATVSSSPPPAQLSQQVVATPTTEPPAKPPAVSEKAAMVASGHGADLPATDQRGSTVATEHRADATDADDAPPRGGPHESDGGAPESNVGEPHRSAPTPATQPGVRQPEPLGRGANVSRARNGR